MIEMINVTKHLDTFPALSEVTCQIPAGTVYGLIGSNGAGKSTLLRAITGIYQIDAGSITLNGNPVYEHPASKEKMMFVPDELFFMAGASLKRMAESYRSYYPRFDQDRFRELVDLFKLNPNKNTNHFSKGMKRQGAIILALSTRAEYLFFDETFDGLDPVKRNLVRNLLAKDAIDHGTTVIITSHSLRELEDTCDQLALLHNGKIVFESDVQNLKTSLFKIQIAFRFPFGRETFSNLDLLSYSQQGSVANLIVRGAREQVQQQLSSLKPILLELLPLSLEEVFIYEMADAGYVFKDILGGEEHV